MNTAKLRRLLWIIAGVLIVFMVGRVLKNHNGTPSGTSAGYETESSSAVVTFDVETGTISTEASSTQQTTRVEKTTKAPETTEAPKTTAEKSTEETTIEPEPEDTTTEPELYVEEDGEYSDKEHVALYIHEFNHLPSNYISKQKAESLGWIASKGNLWKVAPGKSIGGSHFGNYEGQLPKAKGRKYYECDVDFDGKYRNAKRIIYSNDGLIYYTDDHYETFELLYD